MQIVHTVFKGIKHQQKLASEGVLESVALDINGGFTISFCDDVGWSNASIVRYDIAINYYAEFFAYKLWNVVKVHLTPKQLPSN